MKRKAEKRNISGKHQNHANAVTEKRITVISSGACNNFSGDNDVNSDSN